MRVFSSAASAAPSLLLLSLALAATGAACGGDDSADGGDGGPDATATNDDGGGNADATTGSDGNGGSDTSAPDLGTPSPFGLDTRPSNPTCLAPARPPSTAAVVFQQVFAGVAMQAPMAIRQIPGDPSRIFVAERPGAIVSFPATNPTGTPTTVYTVANVNQSGEGGLLGFAFHPKFATNGLMYFSYTKNDTSVAGSNMRSIVARVHSADGGKTFGEYTELVDFPQTTATNHKGGMVAFDANGYLFFSFGDGGGGGDGYHHGQFPDSYFAKIHRIDVDTPPPAGKTYVVPADNPFASGGGQDSTYTWGLRNPFRFSFDRATNDLWIGDVGQDAWEEVDRVQAPGANGGWSCYEATHPYALGDLAKCPDPNRAFLAPVYEYAHNGASKAVIGGVVYRGKKVPSMLGTYVFGDEPTGQLWALAYDNQGKATTITLNGSGPSGIWSGFWEDLDGEIFVTDVASSKIYEMLPAPATDAGAAPPFPATLSATGCVDPNDATKPAPGVVPYTVNSPLWSDGASKERWLAIPDGTTIDVGADGHLNLPIGSVLMKTFSVGGVRVETRLLVHHTDGDWAGYTYEWNDQGTDANLLPSSKTKAVGSQTWYYPSRSDCFNCHATAAGRSLGMLEGQLNGNETYPSTGRYSNQLATLDHVGMLTTPLGTPVDQIEAFPTPTGTAGTLEQRAKSYLQANCAICHRPGGTGGGPMNALYDVPLGDMDVCDVAPSNGDLGITGAKMLVPGDPTKSMVSIRPHRLDADRMPPIASHVVDTAGVGVVDQWITSLTSCPAPTDAGADASDASDASDQ